jgi:ABC-2 type transport system permease protein
MPFVYGLILSAFGQVEWGILFANFLALFLLGTAFIAVGTLISALTENQVAAAVLGIAALLVIQMIDSLVSYINITWLADAVKSLSFWTRYYAVTCGLFNVSTVIFYLSAAFIFNYLTIRVFERRRWS